MRLNFLRRTRTPDPVPAAFSGDPARCAEPVVAIGDVHGEADLLAQLLERIEAQHPGHRIVGLGDYIDRGENSARVLELLEQADALCLRGNHEEMLLDFLDDPAGRGPSWLGNGGLQTLFSLRVAGPSASTDPAALHKVAQDLTAALGADRLAWLRGLPRSWQSGNVGFVHAGADPALAFDKQADRALTWGHPHFARVPRADGLWIVHGHRVVPEAAMADGVISVDTGAYATGRLSAVVLNDAGVSFLST